MKPRSRTTVAALARWQHFKESQAGENLRRSAGRARQAAERADAANASGERADRSLSELLGAERLNLGRIQAAIDIRTAAESRQQGAAAALEAARCEQHAARDAHSSERIKARTIDERMRRKAAAQQDRSDKLAFDRMADAHMQTQRRSRDG